MIRLASFDDLPRIVAIYNEAVAHRFATADLQSVTLDQRVAWFREHDGATFPIYVLESEEAVCGWCSLSAYRPGREALQGTAELSYYVSYDFHGRGIGSELVRHALAVGASLGKRALFAIVLERNEPSVRLLEKCGFDLWGRLPDVALIKGELVSHLYYGRKI